jgi:NTP pyrophosphatase (non-canonical NTP hydrolase)
MDNDLLIRSMQKAVHALAKEKGWHSSPDMDKVVNDFAFKIDQYVTDEIGGSCDQSSEPSDLAVELVREMLACRFTSPEDKIPQMFINIMGEVSEAWEEYRANRKGNETYYETDKNGNQKPLGIPTELADVVIRVMDTCEVLGIDLQSAIEEKHKYNSTRAYRHGGKKA